MFAFGHCSTNGTRGAGFVDERGQVTIAEQIAIRDANQIPPNMFLKLRAAKLERQVENLALLREVLDNLFVNRLMDGMVWMVAPTVLGPAKVKIFHLSGFITNNRDPQDSFARSSNKQC